jgi:hypothetical protein
MVGELVELKDNLAGLKLLQPSQIVFQFNQLTNHDPN